MAEIAFDSMLIEQILEVAAGISATAVRVME